MMEFIGAVQFWLSIAFIADTIVCYYRSPADWRKLADEAEMRQKRKKELAEARRMYREAVSEADRAYKRRQRFADMGKG